MDSSLTYPNTDKTVCDVTNTMWRINQSIVPLPEIFHVERLLSLSVLLHYKKTDRVTVHMKYEHVCKAV